MAERVEWLMNRHLLNRKQCVTKQSITKAKKIIRIRLTAKLRNITVGRHLFNFKSKITTDVSRFVILMILLILLWLNTDLPFYY